MKCFITSRYQFLRKSYLRSFSSYAAKFESVGDPLSVLRLERTESSAVSLKEYEVELKFLAAPINPSDVNMIEGVYGIKAKLPAIGGNEGVAEVTKVGAGVKSLQTGDWVIPAKASFGTWRQIATAEESQLLKVANDIPAVYAATISVNPCTAYRLLEDFEKLGRGDVIIQNGANSMVGLAVVQMARERGITTINVVRSDGPDVEKKIKLLTKLGGDITIPDTFLKTHSFREIIRELPPCRLALNCVGGETAVDMARVLATNGTMVTYGGMSKKPVVIPFDLLAYRQLKLKGFWMTRWCEENPVESRMQMLADITGMIRDQKLSFFFALHDFDDLKYALEKSLEPFNFRKIVLNLNYPDRMKEHDSKQESAYEMFEAPAEI